MRGVKVGKYQKRKKQPTYDELISEIKELLKKERGAGKLVYVSPESGIKPLKSFEVKPSKETLKLEKEIFGKKKAGEREFDEFDDNGERRRRLLKARQEAQFLDEDPFK